MSMEIDHSKPLTAEQKKWLHEWSLDHEIETNERLHGQAKAHAKGEPIDVRKALDKAGVEVPNAPQSPGFVAGQPIYQGPVVVEGENDTPPAPGEPSVVVPLPRDHPLTGTVATDQGWTEPTVSAETQEMGGTELQPETDEGKFDTRAARKEVEELTVAELKDNLRDLDEPVSGNQKELQDRLVKALKKAHDEERKQAE
jgi:hypothetical protein